MTSKLSHYRGYRGNIVAWRVVASNSLFEGCECELKSLCDTGSCSNYIGLVPGACTVYWHTHRHTHSRATAYYYQCRAFTMKRMTGFWEKENDCRSDRSIRTNLGSMGEEREKFNTMLPPLVPHSLHSSRGSSFSHQFIAMFLWITTRYAILIHRFER